MLFKRRLFSKLPSPHDHPDVVALVRRIGSILLRLLASSNDEKRPGRVISQRPAVSRRRFFSTVSQPNRFAKVS
jgi:hypothetical protein